MGKDDIAINTVKQHKRCRSHSSRYVLPTKGISHFLTIFIDQIKGNKIGLSCFSAKRALLRSKRNDWLARKQPM